jgi:acetylglutamate kinase
LTTGGPTCRRGYRNDYLKRLPLDVRQADFLETFMDVVLGGAAAGIPGVTALDAGEELDMRSRVDGTEVVIDRIGGGRAGRWRDQTAQCCKKRDEFTPAKHGISSQKVRLHTDFRHYKLRRMAVKGKPPSRSDASERRIPPLTCTPGRDTIVLHYQQPDTRTVEEAIRKADVLIEAMPYIMRFAGRPVVIKFGGNAMESEKVLDDVLEDVVFLATVGIHAIVVHGGGPQISDAMGRAGLEPRFVEGHRVTDADTLEVVVEVLSAQVNADICRRIESLGGRASSVFRNGHSPLRARKRKMSISDGSGGRKLVDIGFVGEIVSVDGAGMLEACADATVLVVPPIGEDDEGQLYNVNADTAAGAIAAGVGAEKVVFLSNVHGIMSDPERPDSLLSTVREGEIETLIAHGAITGGMLPKVSACVTALDAGVRKAHIIDGRLPHSLLLEIFTDRGVGTQILQED